MHVRLTDLNTLKSNFEKLEFDIPSDTFDLADFVYDDNDNIVVACTKYDAYSSILVYNVNYLRFIHFFCLIISILNFTDKARDYK